MSKFKVGDRAFVYRASGRVLVSLTNVSLPDYLIGEDEGGVTIRFHRKQCRRLIKKERRRVFVFTSDLEDNSKNIVYTANSHMKNKLNLSNYTEFVEVRKEKK